MRFAGLCTVLCVLLSFSTRSVSSQLATEVILEEKLTGLGVITDIKNAGDDRLFIVSRDGLIRIVEFDVNDNASVLPTPFIDLSQEVTDSGERGLLGLAFHPNFSSNGYFFVYYTCQGSAAPCSSSTRDTILARYTASGNQALPSSRLYIAVFDQPYTNHNGGHLAFNDGKLYVGTGDGGSGNDPGRRSLDLDTPLGKLLRVDIDNMNETLTVTRSQPRWNIPSDNPYVNDVGCSFTNDAISQAIWAYGLRNPWRFSFDALTRDLWIADVGQNAQEEVDFTPASSNGGENYGWGLYEGTLNNDANYPGSQSDLSSTSFTQGCFSACQDVNCLVFPDLTYANPAVGRSITGGYVYRGIEYAAELNGTYFYADYVSNRLWGARSDGQGGWATPIEFVDAFFTDPTTFGEDNLGEIYVGTANGRLYHIKPLIEAEEPSAAPSVSSAPSDAPEPTPFPTESPTPAPTPIIDCPLEYDKTVNIATGVDLSYAVRVPQDPVAIATYGGILCAQLVAQSLAWISFGISTNGDMVGSDAIIGLPDEPASQSNPGKYDLSDQNVAGVNLMSSNMQTLINATIQQDATMTTLTFTKLLKEANEIEILAEGSNTFLYAIGQDNALDKIHADRGSFALDFSGCNDNGSCDLGEDCASCPNDCPIASSCGNGICETGGSNGEDCVSCPADCEGKLNGKKSDRFCCGRETPCFDNRCSSCTTDAPVQSCCGDGICESTETPLNCAQDCSPVATPTDAPVAPTLAPVASPTPAPVVVPTDAPIVTPTEAPAVTCPSPVSDTACSTDEDCCRSSTGSKCRQNGSKANTCT